MSYKDPDKQREANRLQMKRARAKGNTKPTTNQGNTEYHCVTGKPGDVDYNGVCTEVWRAERGR